MTTLTVEPIRPDIGFGARVGGVTRDALRRRRRRAPRSTASSSGTACSCSRSVEPNPQMQVAISTVDRSAEGPPEQGDATRRRRARRHRDPPPARRGRQGRGCAGEELSQWLPWHFDHCYNDELNRAGVLRAVEIPPDGGRTGFVDGIALYDAISPELRDRIEGETVLYAMDVILDNLRFGRPADLVEVEASPEAEAVMVEFADRPRALHPAVWTRRDRREGAARVAVDGEGPRRPRGRRRRRAARRGVRRDLRGGAGPLLLPPVAARPTWSIWDNWRVLHSVSGMTPERRPLHAPHHDQGRLRPRPLRAGGRRELVGAVSRAPAATGPGRPRRARPR